MTFRRNHCFPGKIDQPAEQENHGQNPRQRGDCADLRLDKGADKQKGNHNCYGERCRGRKHNRTLRKLASMTQPIKLTRGLRVILAL